MGGRELTAELLAEVRAGAGAGGRGVAGARRAHTCMRVSVCAGKHKGENTQDCVCGVCVCVCLPVSLQGLPYTEAVIKEAMRLYPPVPYLLRQAREDLDLGKGMVAPK